MVTEERLAEAKGWAHEWPTVFGWYWFYGKRYDPQDKPMLYMVYVRGVGNNGRMYVVNGAFIFKEEAVGVWQKADVPEVPSDE